VQASKKNVKMLLKLDRVLNRVLRNRENVPKYSDLDLYVRIRYCEYVEAESLRLRVCFERSMNIRIKIKDWNE
jgi:hypothetical protein